MATLPEGLFDAVRAYLKITWQDDATDTEVTGYINRGMARLQHIAGAPLDYTVEDQPRALLLDYCRYARSQALEVFEKNFEAELLDLHLTTQAPIIDPLVVIAALNTYGTYDITVSPFLDAGNSYVYQADSDPLLPARLETCAPGIAWMEWDGISPIAAAYGIKVVEINSEYGAERAGTVSL